MASKRSPGLIILTIGSLFLLLNVITIFINYFVSGWYEYATLIDWATLGINLFGAIFLLLGFVIYQMEQGRQASGTGTVISSEASSTRQFASFRFCPKCGRQIPPEAKYCLFCGSHIEGNQ
jgi:hypothetical protein